MFSIRRKVSIALSTVLVLHVITAVMGHYGLEKTRSDITVYEQFNNDTIRVLGIDRTITELQRNVALFILSGHDSAADRVRELLRRAELKIEHATREARYEETTALLREMSERIGAYGESFEKVAIDRATRQRLVQNDMHPTMATILDRLDSIHARGASADSGIGQARRLVLEGESAALKYFDAPNRASVQDAIARFREARATLEHVSTETETEGRELAGLVESYERSFVDAVTATRGYLHLVNVVLAGEAAQLLRQSSSIRSQSLSSRDEYTLAMYDEAKRFQVISDVVAVLTVLAGVVTAWLLTRMILPPIRTITGTFKRLAEGDHTAEVAVSTRRDEIGALEQAARVFKDRNEETERLLDETRVLAQNLERRNEEMTQFVYSVSHDLKAPLVTVQGFTGLLKNIAIQQDREEAESLFGSVDRAVKRMATTLDDLLALSRIDAIEHERQPIDLRAICDDLAADLTTEIEREGVVLERAQDPPMIVANKVQMKQLLQNLVQNAIRYGKPEDGPHVVTINARKEADGVTVSVADRGPGIDARYAELVFRLFQRVDTERSSGTGIGLTIVKKIVETHGGRVWFDSSPSEGTTFYCWFPNAPKELPAAA